MQETSQGTRRCRRYKGVNHQNSVTPGIGSRAQVPGHVSGQLSGRGYAGRTQAGLGDSIVSELYDLKVRIEERIKADGRDVAELKGKIGLKAGMLLALISANAPDQPEKVAKLRLAAKEVLNMSM